MGGGFFANSMDRGRMRILVAEDDPVSSRLLEDLLEVWDYEVEVARDGQAAWEALHSERPPAIALLDWMMPKMDGVEIVRRVRQLNPPAPPYLILLTARADKADIVAGLESGADDYLTKPFDPPELRERLRVGCRIIDLQSRLADRVAELEIALANVKQLQGLLPICAYCKSIRDDHNYWQRVESYLADHADVRFTHGICPNCLEQEMKSFSAVKSAAG